MDNSEDYCNKYINLDADEESKIELKQLIDDSDIYKVQADDNYHNPEFNFYEYQSLNKKIIKFKTIPEKDFKSCKISSIDNNIKNESTSISEKMKLYKLEIILSIMLLFEIILWNKSLENCTLNDDDDCIMIFREKLVFLFLTISISSFLFSLILIISIYSQFKYRIRILMLIYFLFLCFKSKGTNFKDHSMINLIIFCFLIFFFMSFYYSIVFLNFLRKKALYFLALGILFWIYLGLFIGMRMIKSCDNINDSLNKDYKIKNISNNSYHKQFNQYNSLSNVEELNELKEVKNEDKLCQWKSASICYNQLVYEFKIFKPFFINRDSCSLYEPILKPYIEKLKEFHDKRDKDNNISDNNDYLIVSLPNMREHSKTLSRYNFMDLNFSNMGVVKSKEEISLNSREVFYDFSETNIKDIINGKEDRLDKMPNVIFDIKELGNLYEYDKIKENEYNILDIFIDTLSRQNFHRRYSMLKKWLSERHYSLNKNISSFEFFRNHSIRGYTRPNVIASQMGVKDTTDMKNMDLKKTIEDDYKLNKIKNKFTYAKESGYVVGLSYDNCIIYLNGSKFYTEIDKYIGDHTMFQTACNDENSPFIKNDTLDIGTGPGPYTMHLNCLFKRNLLSYNNEYAVSFFDKYRDYKKYFSLNVIDAHEISGELNNLQIDKEISDLLIKLENKGHLDNTIIRIWSDHGDHTSGLSYLTLSGDIERYNPFMSVIVPESFKKQHGEIIIKNTQALLSPYDHFRTDMKLFGKNDKYMNGLDYLTSEISYSRTCEEALLDHKCLCK